MLTLFYLHASDVNTEILKWIVYACLAVLYDCPANVTQRSADFIKPLNPSLHIYFTLTQTILVHHQTLKPSGKPVLCGNLTLLMKNCAI